MERRGNESQKFYPNSISESDIYSLEDWQLLVAVCHFAPRMGDCVYGNYSYTIERPSVHLGSGPEIFCGDISLNGDIDIERPLEALEHYADFDWKDWARDKLLAYLKRREEEL